MGTLSLDVELARQTVSTLQREQGNMVDLRSRMDASHQRIMGAWEGNASRKFDEEYRALSSTINSQINQLDALTTRLNSEIEQWVQAAGAFEG